MKKIIFALSIFFNFTVSAQPIAAVRNPDQSVSVFVNGYWVKYYSESVCQGQNPILTLPLCSVTPHPGNGEIYEIAVNGVSIPRTDVDSVTYLVSVLREKKCVFHETNQDCRVELKFDPTLGVEVYAVYSGWIKVITKVACWKYPITSECREKAKHSLDNYIDHLRTAGLCQNTVNF